MTTDELITLRLNAHFASLAFFRGEVERNTRNVFEAYERAIARDAAAGYERVVEAASRHDAAHDRLQYEINNAERMKRGLE